MSQEMAVCANLLNADRQAFIKAMLTKRGEFGSTLTVICGRAILFCFAFFQLGRCPMTEAGWTRERKLVDELLTFIEQTSGRKIKFSAIANLKTGVIEDPQDRIAAWLKRHLADSYQQGRVASCEWTYDEMDDYYETACKNAYCLADGTLKDNKHKYCPYCGGFIQLAQQAQEGANNERT